MWWVLHQQRRAIVGWSVALAAVSAIYVSFYPAIGAQEMTELIDTLPEDLVQALGYEGIGTAAGYLESTVYSLLAPALMIVFAVGFGARVLAGQEEEGALELELSLPVSRRRVLLERFLAMLVQLVVFAVVLLAVVAGLVLTLTMEVDVLDIAAATLGLLLLALGMGTVSLAVGAATGRRSMGVAAGACLAVASFMANVLGPLIEGGGWLQTVSPFSWYLGADRLTLGIEWAGAGGLLLITVVALGAAVPIYGSRDLGV